MNTQRFVLKLALPCLIVSLIVCGVQVRAEQSAHAILFKTFASAEAEAATPDADASLQSQYDKALTLLDAQDYQGACSIFESLGDFSDSAKQADACLQKWNAARYQEAVEQFENGQYREAMETFQALGKYKKSRSYLNKAADQVRSADYKQAKQHYQNGEYADALALYESLGKFRDSRKKAEEAAEALAAQQLAEAEQKAYDKALSLKEGGDLEGARDAFIEAGSCKDASDQLYEVLAMLGLRATYQKAENAYEQKAYENAYDLFTALDDYEDSAAKAAQAKSALQASVYDEARNTADSCRAYILFLSLGDYEDSAAQATALRNEISQQDLYAAADSLAAAGEYERAKLGFEACQEADSAQRAAQLQQDVQRLQEYKRGDYLHSIGQLAEANEVFKSLGTFRQASERIEPATRRFTAKQLRDDATTPLSPVFTAPDGSQHHYRIYKGVHTWVEAKLFCEVLGGHLATLTTPEENQFVFQFMQSSGFKTAYFGLSDEKRVGDWIWVTGEPVEYTNWNDGEPSRCARERYGMFFYKHTDGTWNDSHFYEHVEVDPGCSYICEWDD